MAEDINQDNNINTRSDNLVELAKAYEADKERKLVREEELQAARDYLGVLLAEAEGRNVELEDTRQEADELAERLSKTEDEVQALKDENRTAGRQSRIATFWMCFSLVELILIAALVIAFYIKLSDYMKNESEAKVDNPVQHVVVNAEPTEAPPAAKPETARYVDDLEQRVKYLSADFIEPFTASTENIDGLEYLVFTSGDIRICYKNEYFLENMSFRKCIIIESGDSRYTFAGNYDLSGDIAELCPVFTRMGAEKLLAFVSYPGAGREGIPTAVKLVSCTNFRMYDCGDLSERINNLIKVEELEEISPIEGMPCVYSLTTSKAAYKYVISEGDYNKIAYNGYEIPELASEFVFEIGEDGIVWNTEVKLGPELYLGRLWGSLALNETGLVISGAKFGAYVPANQEDEELAGCIAAADSVPERYVTINGADSERFLVAVDDSIAPCGYLWENLNTDDPNNWVYYDADGSKASWRGIDVSKYQGTIDWARVAEEGIDFAIIRLGFRGMNEGTLEIDEYFLKNIKGATANGIKVGIYFFSQAVTEEEAVQEAEFVLKNIKDYDITYPVIFDTERVTSYNARANGLSMEERTNMCIAFCDTIADAGYKPMIYANTKYMIMGIDLAKLGAYDRWYAYYSNEVTFPYDFQMFQYSESGSIPGIGTAVDLNISFVDYSAE